MAFQELPCVVVGLVPGLRAVTMDVGEDDDRRLLGSLAGLVADT
ncbi:hypothetical protein [Streptomyces sp. NRRL S-575]|nr:hypothetical protein [Streptomyces sp. NRRL S-575]